jgi:hypothetical protein
MKLSFGLRLIGCACILSAFGCSTDSTPAAPRLSVHQESALRDAPGLLESAEAGTLGRGEQDFLVRFERTLPGFGGLYISGGNVRVYMKPSAVPAARIRAVLAAAYAGHPNAMVRDALKNVSQATILPGAFSLSELVAIENRVVSSGAPGWTGAGVSIVKNRVHVSFSDTTLLERGLPILESMGVPLDALWPTVQAPMSLATTWDSNVRPTRTGIQIEIANNNVDPCYQTWDYDKGVAVWHCPGLLLSLGYNVRRAATGTDYFMTASHGENQFRGINGITGDTIFQRIRITPPGSPIGTIAVNVPWGEGAACPVKDRILLTHYDFCTTADVMLGTYFPGVAFERKIGISVTSGYSGDPSNPPGSQDIRNWYAINGIFSPEYVDDTLHHDAGKSGEASGTTSGEITTPMGSLPVDICFPDRAGCTPNKTILLQNVTEVHAIGWGGDSGAGVFTNNNAGNVAPYAALGILVAGTTGICQGIGKYCTFVFARWDQIEARLGLGSLQPNTTIP